MGSYLRKYSNTPAQNSEGNFREHTAPTTEGGMCEKDFIPHPPVPYSRCNQPYQAVSNYIQPPEPGSRKFSKEERREILDTVSSMKCMTPEEAIVAASAKFKVTTQTIERWIANSMARSRLQNPELDQQLSDLEKRILDTETKLQRHCVEFRQLRHILR